MERTVNIGLMGLGTVGTGVVRLIEGHQEDLVHQTGVRIRIARILVRDPEKPRAIRVSRDLLTTDARDILDDPSIDVVVEVMGHIEPTRQYLLEALRRGKHVVTANKDLMALHGGEILSLAAERGCDVFYEASVAGGIPILRALVEGFSSDRITKLMGIVNGTTNYILTKMTREGADYAEALQEAQKLGYAEADPTSDVDGLDAARKMAILATLGFRTEVQLDEVDVTGIRKVTAEDIAYAKKLGYEIKLLGIAAQEDGLIEVSVEPTLVPQRHPLASVDGVMNAVYVYGEAVGETMFYGPGRRAADGDGGGVGSRHRGQEHEIGRQWPRHGCAVPPQGPQNTGADGGPVFPAPRGGRPHRCAGQDHAALCRLRHQPVPGVAGTVQGSGPGRDYPGDAPRDEKEQGRGAGEVGRPRRGARDQKLLPRRRRGLRCPAFLTRTPRISR